MSRFLKTALLLKPRTELSVAHFAVMVPVYALPMFILDNVFFTRPLQWHVLFALIYGIGVVFVVGFFFVATGGRNAS